jgi:FtsP/CotA-like multicopper oxidase with cupredoxin domain
MPIDRAEHGARVDVMSDATRLQRVILTLALPTLLAGTGAAAGQERTRQYYVAAEEVMWDYAPSRKALIHSHGPSDGIPRPWAGNTRKKKVRYVEYTDATFTIRKPQPEWLGILDPIIRAEVGDTVVVHFLNRAKGRYGIHPHGLRYSS